MRINIVQIYNKNITSKFNHLNKAEYLKFYTLKEREMWQFTLELMKDNFPKEIYDLKYDRTYLTEYLELFFGNKNDFRFTIDEWFNYLKSRE